MQYCANDRSFRFDFLHHSMSETGNSSPRRFGDVKTACLGSIYILSAAIHSTAGHAHHKHHQPALPPHRQPFPRLPYLYLTGLSHSVASI